MRTTPPLLFIVLASLPLWLPLSAEVTIPETRLRIVYKETRQPVEWVMLSIVGWQKWGSRAEEKAYEEKVGAYASMKTVYGGSRFIEAQDGWITIGAVKDPKMDEYRIDIRPAACNILDYSGTKDYANTFTEKSLPKFLALPEQQRVLEAQLVEQCYLPAGTLNPNYEEVRYFIEAYRIQLSHWPELSWAKDCYGVPAKGVAPYYEYYYWGTVEDHLGRLGARFDMDNPYHLGVAPLTKEQRADLIQRIAALFCNDIRAKQKWWGHTGVPEYLQKMEIFKNLHCEGLGDTIYSIPPVPPPSPATPQKEVPPQGPAPSAPSAPERPK